MEHDGDDNISMEMSLVREVGVASLAEVIAHEIVNVAGLTSHHLQLVGGGRIDYAFNQSGKLVELSGFRVQGTITADHRLILRVHGE